MIRILPPELADQIAAGEVVERPASVVKELVENALDAGARRVEIEIEAGGRRLIRVADDGSGMSPDEARLALKRHATSKISSADDLWGLRTFGFRGEALPSIAAVSRLTLSTKTAGSPGGMRLTVEAGVETDAREAGIPDGTQIEVRDLFFNTPARQKFLKSETTESANISEAVLRLGLAHPDVHLRLRAGGRVALDLPPHRELGERVRAALARRGASVLHEANGEEGGHRVRAFLAGPDEASATARSTFLFVGGRFVRDRALLHALVTAYGTILEKGRYPLATLFLEVPGDELDVNVHPQKLEVRFARAQEVYAAVRHVVGQAIGRAPWLERDPARAVRVFTLPPYGTPRAGAAVVSAGRAVALPGSVALGRAVQGALPLRARDAALDSDGQGIGGWGGAAPAEFPVDGGERTQPAQPFGITPFGAQPFGEPAREGFFAALGYVGQLHRTYLVCEAEGELVLIDQHAAHERVAFARLQAAHGRREVRRQRLLFPLPIEVEEGSAAAARESGLLETLGFEIEPASPRAAAAHGDARTTLIVRAVPEMLKDADPKPLLRDVLGQLADGGTAASAAERVDHALATMACHSVVRAGDVLGRQQVMALLSQLDEVDLRSFCPHGRPVLLRMSMLDLERRFGRV
ncbi:MAG TPA: DNA mismatch repair endonuclease MutL [Polyangia bacterium]|nr:DNA mismatch repair endonuclease MutL [Polyangia bacterium]